MQKNIISIVVILVVASVAFFGGMKYGQAKTSTSAFVRGNFGGQTGTAGQFRGQGGANGARGGLGGFTIGSILSADAKSITIGVQGGGSKIVFTSASTTVSKMSPGSIADLTVGTNVMVQGSANADGSLTAQSVQIRPAGMPGVRGVGTSPNQQ